MADKRTVAMIDKIDAAAEKCGDIEVLADRVFEAIAPAVVFDFACVATTDPASELITRAFKSRPLDIGDEDFAAAEYGAPDINRFAELALRPVPVGVLSIDTDGNLDRCNRFREFMAPAFGFTDELRAVCRARGTTWAVLGLYRGPGEPPFTADDGQRIGDVVESIADAVRRVLFAPATANVSPGSGAAVLIVDGTDSVTDMTAAVEEQVIALGGWDNGSLPANVLAIAAQARTTRAPSKARVLSRGGRWLAIQAMPLDGSGAKRSVVVTIDAAPAASIGQMRLAARGLTTREQDIAQLVLQGASTRSIAQTLYLSPHTVQDHLKAIFRKLDVNSRREMIAQLVLPNEQVI